jgi:cytochrome c peroxidase
MNTEGIPRNWPAVLIFKLYAIVAGLLVAGSISVLAQEAESVTIGERPAVEYTMDQGDIDAGTVTLRDLLEHGKRLFVARFNTLDGQGRPASTGTGATRIPDQPAFIRTSGPDSSSCAGCHNQPSAGGAGDFVANVFVLAQGLDPVTFSVNAEFSNERNTLGMHGAGPIEMLAREMSEQLIAIRETSRTEAADSGQAVTRDLVAKGVNFGTITVLPDGRVDPTGIEGIDCDLIIKPFHQKGAVVSLREFTNNAMNHHHGMQSVERFGHDVDPDQDGVVNELSVGDITAVAIFQAALGTPGRNLSKHEARRHAAERGEWLFDQIGCAECHIPTLTLNSSIFTEPNPFNPPGNLKVADVPATFAFDMTAEGIGPRLEKSEGGGAIVHAFTDLKRHNLNDDDYNFFGNERLPQGKLNGFAPVSDFTVDLPVRPTYEFLTRKLWDAGNTGPYGHRGDLTTMTDAIHFHGGEARRARDAYFGLEQEDRDAIVEFLKSLQVLPPSPARNETE